jgi:hypothetical protein
MSIQHRLGGGYGNPAMDTGRVGEVREQTFGTLLQSIYQEAIQIPDDRERALNSTKLADIKASLAVGGLLHPIGVKETKSSVPKEFRLLYGLHRCLGWRELHDEAVAKLEKLESDDKKVVKAAEQEVARWQRIPAIVYPATVSDELCRFFEITENLQRADLTASERKRLAADYAELAEIIRTDRPNSPAKSKGGPRADPWFVDWYEGASIPKQTARGWWSDFLASTGQDNVSPGKADVSLRKRFFAWLKSAQSQQAKAKAKPKHDAIEDEEPEEQKQEIEPEHHEPAAGDGEAPVEKPTADDRALAKLTKRMRAELLKLLKRDYEKADAKDRALLYLIVRELPPASDRARMMIAAYMLMDDFDCSDAFEKWAKWDDGHLDTDDMPAPMRHHLRHLVDCVADLFDGDDPAEVEADRRAALEEYESRLRG